MSADNYIVVDHDGDVFQLLEGSMSCKLEDEDYKPTLMDTVATAKEVDVIIADYGYTEYGVEWTENATFVSHDTFEAYAVLKRVALADEATHKALDELSKLHTKMVTLANKLDEHLKKPDAHNPAFMYKDKK